MADSQYPNDIQFAGLVQAATAAAGQDGQWSRTEYPSDAQRENGRTASDALDGPPIDDSDQRPPKRRRTSREDLPQGQYIPLDDAQHESPPDGSHGAYTATSDAHNDAAKALFREPSEKSRRYTRPPMSTLYTSLRLTPENFLRLQAAAKDYMLDDRFPERRSCVGKRGAGDNADMVKLKLWNCVKDFLDLHGNGERFWGATPGDVNDENSGVLFWPRDSQAIIKLCVPLLRRMVTNERQRRYAASARKSGRGQMSQDDENAVASMFGLSNTLHDDVELSSIDDILQEGCVPTVLEAETWYRHGDLTEAESLKKELKCDDLDMRQIVANIDSHLELFHRGQITCSPSCQQRVIEKLDEWLTRRDSLEAEGLVDHRVEHGALQALLEARRASSQRRHGEQHRNAANEQQAPTLEESSESRRTNKQQQAIDQIATSSMNGSSAASTKNNLKILVNLVSNEASTTASAKRLLPCFALTPESATNLSALRTEVQKRQVSVLSPESSDGARFTFKVWLPDGLVQVKDDGEWAIALLSAGMVEWMDGEVRVLVDVQK